MLKKFSKHILLTAVLCLSTVVAIPVLASEITQQQEANLSFIDVNHKYWAKDEILHLAEQGILVGQRDLQFRPDIAITVEEALEAVRIALQLDIQLVTTKNTELTREQLAVMTQEMLQLLDTQEIAMIKDALDTTPEYVKSVNNVVAKGWMETNFLQQFEPQKTVTRAEFAVQLHKILEEKEQLTRKSFVIEEAELSDNFTMSNEPVSLVKLSFDEHPIYLRSSKTITFTDHELIDNGFSRDNVYHYAIGKNGVAATITVRSFDNGDHFLFSRLDNPTAERVVLDVIQKENFVESYELFRYDRYKIKRNDNDVFGQDVTSYPTGILRFVKTDGSIQERMVGQAYVSEQLELEYENGGKSYMRHLIDEQEAISYAMVDTTLMSIHTLHSTGRDIVDQWYMDSDAQIFESDENRENWLQETALYYKKRNDWYTAEGPYNKMATTTEPMPEDGRGYGRNLLLMKEDRALVLYKEQNDRYFENLVYNSYVNLKNFKKDKDYWQTEVTSTHLKENFGLTAPFIDTRFNEQIALFYYNSGEAFGLEDYKEPLRNYADLLVSRKEAGHVINVTQDAYYISDYFPVNQEVTTQTSMNHLLGGMNLLLKAYLEFEDEQYLAVASSIMKAIDIHQDDWIRENGDIWYRISTDYSYKGDDYKHLTLEDLINSYQLWKQVDSTKLPLLEKFIASKSAYLSNENLGYTKKIYNGLEQINKLEYLPNGIELTDAL